MATLRSAIYSATSAKSRPNAVNATAVLLPLMLSLARLSARAMVQGTVQ